MEHFVTAFQDLHTKAWFGKCSCEAKLQSSTAKSMVDLIDAHLDDIRKLELKEDGKISLDLLNSYLHHGMKPPAFFNLKPGECDECDDEDKTGSCHIGSPLCRSHGLGAGGGRSHCTCDACF